MILTKSVIDNDEYFENIINTSKFFDHLPQEVTIANHDIYTTYVLYLCLTNPNEFLIDHFLKNKLDNFELLFFRFKELLKSKIKFLKKEFIQNFFISLKMIYEKCQNIVEINFDSIISNVLRVISIEEVNDALNIKDFLQNLCLNNIKTLENKHFLIFFSLFDDENYTENILKILQEKGDINNILIGKDFVFKIYFKNLMRKYLKIEYIEKVNSKKNQNACSSQLEIISNIDFEKNQDTCSLQSDIISNIDLERNQNTRSSQPEIISNGNIDTERNQNTCPSQLEMISNENIDLERNENTCPSQLEIISKNIDLKRNQVTCSSQSEILLKNIDLERNQNTCPSQLEIISNENIDLERNQVTCSSQPEIISNENIDLERNQNTCSLLQNPLPNMNIGPEKDQNIYSSQPEAWQNMSSYPYFIETESMRDYNDFTENKDAFLLKNTHSNSSHLEIRNENNKTDLANDQNKLSSQSVTSPNTNTDLVIHQNKCSLQPEVLSSININPSCFESTDINNNAGLIMQNDSLIGTEVPLNMSTYPSCFQNKTLEKNSCLEHKEVLDDVTKHSQLSSREFAPSSSITSSNIKNIDCMINLKNESDQKFFQNNHKCTIDCTCNTNNEKENPFENFIRSDMDKYLTHVSQKPFIISRISYECEKNLNFLLKQVNTNNGIYFEWLIKRNINTILMAHYSIRFISNIFYVEHDKNAIVFTAKLIEYYEYDEYLIMSVYFDSITPHFSIDQSTFVYDFTEYILLKKISQIVDFLNKLFKIKEIKKNFENYLKKLKVDVNFIAESFNLEKNHKSINLKEILQNITIEDYYEIINKIKKNNIEYIVDSELESIIKESQLWNSNAQIYLWKILIHQKIQFKKKYIFNNEITSLEAKEGYEILSSIHIDQINMQK